MFKKFMMGLVIGLGCVAGYVLAASFPVKYPTQDYDAQGVVLYARNATDNSIVPLQVDSSGALLVNTSL